jgi:Glycosyl hydrolase catalytic core
VKPWLGVIGAVLACLGGQSFVLEAAQGAPRQRSRPGGEKGEPRVSYDLSRSPFGLHVITTDLAGPREIGARWTRTSVEWKDVEPSKGQLRGLERALPRLNELSEAGFEILPRINSVNPWAEEERINRMNAEAAGKRAPMGALTYIGMPTDLASYRRFLTTVVESFDGDGSGDVPGMKKGIKYWQIENEWDWRWKDTPEKFVEFLRIGYETIKAADPEAKVVLGGISKLGPDAFHAGLLGDKFELNGRVITPAMLERQKHFKEEYPLRTYVLKHGHRYFDILSFHQYGRYQAIEKEVEYLRSIMGEQHYAKPLWMTEAGGPFEPYGEAYTEDRQAQEVVKYYVTALASGVEVIFWSTYLPTPEWGKAFTNTALLEGRARKKPAYYSYKLMTSKLHDAIRVESLFSSARGQIVRFIRKTGTPIYVAWSEGGDGARAPAADGMRALLHGKLEGKTLEITWYDGKVQTVRDLRGDAGGLLRKGPAFIEIR